MNDQHLRAELNRVTQRYRVFIRSLGLVMLWLVLGLAGMAGIRYLRGQDYQPALIGAAAVGILGLALVPWFVVWMKRYSDPLWLARRIEQEFPDLDARLLAALEQHPEKDKGLGFLQQVVIDQSVTHAKARQWVELVPSSKIMAARLANWGMFAVCAVVAFSLAMQMKASQGHPVVVKAVAPPPVNFTIKVVPEDTSIERNTALLVTAEFNKSSVPTDVELLLKDADGSVQTISMSKALDDPLFGTRIQSVKKDSEYAVKYGAEETKWYKVSVFDYPSLKQADADLKFPEYTGLEEKVLKDTRSVTGVEGTHTTLTFHLNKAVADARLVPAARRGVVPGALGAASQPATQPGQPAQAAGGGGGRGAALAGGRGAGGGRGARGGANAAASTAPVMIAATGPAEPLQLTQDPSDPTTYTVSMDLKQSQVYTLQLTDSEQRNNRDRPNMTINVTANRPPTMTVQTPNRDLDVSALEEITVKAQVWDDYGVKKVGMTYSIAGQDPKDVIFAENIPGKERRDIASVISLEKLNAEPDQLLTYHLWVEDVGPDGKPRRTEGAMFFADVRPFEEIYYQGEAQAQGAQDPQDRQQRQQQQQQQQGQQGGNQNAQRADQVATTLKQVIAATWNIQRRETSFAPSEQFVPDVTSVENSLTRIREQSDGLNDQVTDDRSKTFLASGLKNMDTAIEKLNAAESGPAIAPLPDAVTAEQAAYQDLLKLRAREFEVTRGQQGQQGQQSASQQRRQQQVNQMNANQQQNPYQSRRNAQQQQQQQQAQQQQQQETDEQRETRQVLSRLRDLAQRQDDLNRQMQEMQSALQQAQTPEQRDELQRQLANLRDQQQQQLRDADELRDRLDQPQNQEQMANTRQQLDQTRNNIQQASQNLNNGQMQQAQAAGQRASEQLNNLTNQVQRAAAGQFNQQMTQMRQDAQNLEQQQQQIQERIANLEQPAQTAPTGLRNQNEQAATQERQQIVQDLTQQKQQLQNLLDNMQETVTQAETPQPLLSRQLYDTFRNAQQQQPDKALDTSRQLMQQGLLQEARQTNGDATQTITQIRQGVDQAATGVLGDDTDALRRARAELDNIAQAVQQEMNQARAATQPGGGGRGNQANATQPGRGGRGDLANATQPNGRGAGAGTQPDERQLANAGGRGQAGDRGSAGTQPDERQLAGGGQPGARGGQPGQRGGAGAGTQPDERQLAGGGQPGARGGQPGQRGGAGAGTQPDERQLAQGPGQPGDQQGRGAAGRGGQPGDPNGQDPQGRGGAGRGAQPGDQQARGGAGRGQPGDQQPGDQQARGGAGRGGQPGDQQDPQQARGGAGRGGQPGDQQPGDQQDPQQARGGAGRGGQPGDQQARGGAGRGGQPGDQQPGDQQDPQQARGGAGRGGQPGDQQARGGGAGRGQPGDPQGAGGGQPGDQQDPQLARGGRGGTGLRPNGRGGAGAGTQPGDPQIAGTQPGDPNQADQQDPNGQPGRGGRGGRGQVARGGAGGTTQPDDPQNPNGGPLGEPYDPNQPQIAAGGQIDGPITGGGFRNFSDSLRNVEEVVNDPRLRAQAQTIRQNVTNLRADYVRGSGPPTWDMVQTTLNRPLTDLRNKISQEIQRRESAQAQVPLDKDNVPPGYQDQVRTYYERLGSGK